MEGDAPHKVTTGNPKRLKTMSKKGTIYVFALFFSFRHKHRLKKRKRKTKREYSKTDAGLGVCRDVKKKDQDQGVKSSIPRIIQVLGHWMQTWGGQNGAQTGW